MIKISVIIPVYNVERYLNECLDSVCRQTLNEIEIICIDDGSTDNSANILQEYAQKDARIRIITQKNAGVSKARNEGLKIAAGEYVSFIDSDDWIEDNFLKNLYINAVKENADICGCGFKLYKSNRFHTRLKYKKITKAHSLNDKFNLFNMPAYNYVTNKIYRKRIIINNNLWFNEGHVYEDIIWSSSAMEACKKAIAIPDVYYFYRYNESSIVNTTDIDSKKQDDYNFAREFQSNFIKKHHLKIKETFDTKTKISFLGLRICKISAVFQTKKFFLFGIKILEIKYSKH